MPVVPFRGILPRIAPGVFIAPTAYVVGDVVIGEKSSLWYGAVVRGDDAPVEIGIGVNIQDNCAVHIQKDMPTRIGDYSSLGHGAIVHASVIEDHVLIGIGAVVLSGCTIGAGSIIGAGSVVVEGSTIPPRSLVLGVPGRVVRQVTEAEYQRILRTAENYLELSRQALG